MKPLRNALFITAALLLLPVSLLLGSCAGFGASAGAGGNGTSEVAAAGSREAESADSSGAAGRSGASDTSDSSEASDTSDVSVSSDAKEAKPELPAADEPEASTGRVAEGRGYRISDDGFDGVVPHLPEPPQPDPGAQADKDSAPGAQPDRDSETGAQSEPEAGPEAAQEAEEAGTGENGGRSEISYAERPVPEEAASRERTPASRKKVPDTRSESSGGASGGEKAPGGGATGAGDPTEEGEPAEEEDSTEEGDPAGAGASAGSEKTAGSAAQPETGVSSLPGAASAVKVPELESADGHRSVWANPGDTVDLFFPGRGWVYDQGSSSAAGVEFRERYYDEERTEFVFRVNSPGSFQLTFYREDMGTGEQEKRIVDLISSAEGRPERAAGISSRPKDRDTPVQDTMSTGSRIEQAIAGSDAGYLAKHVEELTRWAAGRRDASSEEDEIAETASSGEVAQALGLALNAARLLSENGYEHEARKILDRGLENDSAGEDQLEEIYFALGKLYEKPGPLRDEPTAVGYYRKVVHGFPSGVYWQEAKERIRYLERHYLQLR